MRRLFVGWLCCVVLAGCALKSDTRPAEYADSYIYDVCESIGMTPRGVSALLNVFWIEILSRHPEAVKDVAGMAKLLEDLVELEQTTYLDVVVTVLALAKDINERHKAELVWVSYVLADRLGKPMTLRPSDRKLLSLYAAELLAISHAFSQQQSVR